MVHPREQTHGAPGAHFSQSIEPLEGGGCALFSIGYKYGTGITKRTRLDRVREKDYQWARPRRGMSLPGY